MARKGLPGKYIRAAAKSGSSKTMMKRAWAAYKKAKKSRSSGNAAKTVTKKTSGNAAKKVTKKVSTSKPKTKKKVGTNMQKKKSMGRPRMPKLFSQKTIDTLINGAIVGIGALGGLFLINKIPWIQEQRAWVKAGIQGAIGAVLVALIPQQMGKSAAIGLIAGGAISIAMPFMPEGLQFAPRTAGSRTLSQQELRALQTLGIPADISTMGRPVDISSVSSMGRSGTRSGLRKRY